MTETRFLGRRRRWPRVLPMALLLGPGSCRLPEHDVPKACGLHDMLAADDIELVVNLTIPKAHAPVALQALDAGKQRHGPRVRQGVTQAVRDASAKGEYVVPTSSCERPAPCAPISRTGSSTRDGFRKSDDER